jgi:cytochrome P450 family 144
MTSQLPEIDPLFDPAVMQDPYDYYRQLRDHDPVHEIPGSGGAYLVTRAETIFEVVKRPDLFSSMSGEFLHKGEWATPALRPLTSSGYAAAPAGDDNSGGGGLAGADPPAHERQRTVVSRRLSTASMRAMEPEFQALMNQALSDIPPDGRFEWMSRVAEPLPMIMVARILGLPDSLAPQLKKQGYESLERISGFVSEERIKVIEGNALADLAVVIDAYTQAKEGVTPYTGTMIGILAQAVIDHELNDFEAVSILNVLIAAGGESTTSLTGTAVRILAEQPDLQDQLRTNPSLVPTFVEEACRYDPPFRGHYRTVTQDTTLDGTPIPAGSHLILMWPAANRDPRIYDRPEEVRLDRPNPRYHLGFGWGIHLCVGAPLARIEAKVAIQTLLARTRRFQIEPDTPPLRYHLNLMVRRLITLPLQLELTR